MALTGAEKQARMRKRRKEHPDIYENFLAKDRERKRKARATVKGRMTTSEYAEHLATERARIQCYREKQRRLKIKTTMKHPSQGNPFKTRQSAGKALKRARASLPTSPRKRKAIAAEIAKDAGLNLMYPKKKEGQGISKELTQKVIDFYCLDEISWQAPGRKDCVIIRSKNDAGIKEKCAVPVHVDVPF